MRTSPASISNTVNVAPGSSLKLTVTDASNFYSASCDEALAQLTLQATGSAALTLNSPASEPVSTPTPTLTGTAATAPGDGSAVAVAIFPGTTATGSAEETVTGPVGADGGFSAAITQPLADGEYTAAAVQHAPSGNIVGAPVTFRIQANAPIVTIDQPTSGSRVGESRPMFSGQAGSTPDDSAQVTMLLYRGSSTQGATVGAITVTRSGGTWMGEWPSHLNLGTYTAQAEQSDDAGHLGVSQPTTFRVVVPPKVIGPTVKLSAAGIVSLTVGCAGAPGQMCGGEVRILTVKRFRPLPGSPRGPLQVMFSYVNIPANQTTTVKSSVAAIVRRTLHRAHNVKIRVTATLGPSGGSPITVSVIRTLHL